MRRRGYGVFALASNAPLTDRANAPQCRPQANERCWNASSTEGGAAQGEAAGDCVAGARALAPLIAANAPRIERERAITPEVIAALHEARLFRMLMPRSCGGLEVDPLTYVQALEEIAKADGSTAWCIGQASGRSVSAAYVAPEVAREIFGDARAVMASGPSGTNTKAVVVPGGYRATGSWSFASGIKHAGWLACHCALFEPDGTPRLEPDGKPAERTLLFPKSSARVTDIWRVVGLKGTGSDNYTIEDLFVPDAYSYTRESPDDRRETGPLYRLTIYHLYGMGFAAIALAGARHARCLRRARRQQDPQQPDGGAARQRGGAVAGGAGGGEAAVRARVPAAVAARHLGHGDARRHAFDRAAQPSSSPAPTRASGQGRGRHGLSRGRRHRDLREQSVRAPLPRHAHGDAAGRRSSSFEMVGQVLLGLPSQTRPI